MMIERLVSRAVCWTYRRILPMTKATATPTRTPAAGGDHEVGGDLEQAHRSTQSGNSGAKSDDGGRVVDQRLSLEDGHDSSRHPDPAGDGSGGNRIRRGDHRPQGEGGSERYREQPVGDEADAERREQHQTHREQTDGSPIGSEVDQRGPNSGGVEDRWQQTDEDQFFVEFDLGNEGQVGGDEADDHEQQRCRQAPPAGQAADGDNDRQEKDDAGRGCHRDRPGLDEIEGSGIDIDQSIQASASISIFHRGSSETFDDDHRRGRSN